MPILHLEVALTGASVAARVSGFGEGLSTRVLHSVVVALAVDAIVRNHVASVLSSRAEGGGEEGCERRQGNEIRNEIAKERRIRRLRIPKKRLTFTR